MNFDFESLTSRKKIVVVLAFLTGLLHLLYGALGIYPVASTFDYIFIGNFIGNLFFITILYFTPELEDYRQAIRYLFVAFTMTSIISYFVVYAPGGINSILFPAGIFDKLLEVALIIFILLDRPLDNTHTHNTSSHTTA